MGHYDSCYESDEEKNLQYVNHIRQEAARHVEYLIGNLSILKNYDVNHSDYALTQARVIAKLIKE